MKMLVMLMVVLVFRRVDRVALMVEADAARLKTCTHLTPANTR